MKNDCLFCAIAGGEIPSNKVYEDAVCLAFRDIDPGQASYPAIPVCCEEQHEYNPL